MSIQSATQMSFGFWQGRPIEIERVEENLSSDGGLIAFYQLDQSLGLTESFASLIRRPHGGYKHSALSIVRQRVFGIIAGYEDQNDHDTLRSDPIFKLIAGRQPDDDDLASQPTISRLENSVTPRDLLEMEEWFIDRFVASFKSEPHHITLDIDTFDDPTHGAQQLTFFHGFYNQYQYQVRVITCAENDMVALPVLLFGTAPASLGAAADLVRVIQKLRQRFPDVLIHVRADSGFAVQEFYDELEKLSCVHYTVGYQMNPRTKKASESLLKAAVAAYSLDKKPVREFMSMDYKADRWKKVRKVVIKCEVNGQGTNRRAVVTNRPGIEISPQGVYDDYADRGESENRNKELKREFRADRLSDHRYMANLFRVMLHVIAANLLVELRSMIAEPPEALPSPDDLPLEVRTPSLKRQQHNRRRKADPLGEGHASTWRTMIIKVATRVVISTRRVRLLIASSWPYSHLLEKLGLLLATLPHPRSG